MEEKLSHKHPCYIHIFVLFLEVKNICGRGSQPKGWELLHLIRLPSTHHKDESGKAPSKKRWERKRNLILVHKLYDKDRAAIGHPIPVRYLLLNMQSISSDSTA